MKVLDLHCPQGHVFEGWFGSEGDYQSQCERGLLECPMCGSQDIQKRLSAPRLNLGAKPPKPTAVQPQQGAGRDEKTASAPAAAPSLPPEQQRKLQAIQAAWLKASREIAAKTEDVGDGFAEQARQMHYGEAQQRPIRGKASPEQTMELLEEGIPVLPLALLAKDTEH